MTTIVNNPTPVKESGDKKGSGFLVGIILIIVFLGVILYFAIPALKNIQPIQVNVPEPQINIETPEIEIPDTPEVEIQDTPEVEIPDTSETTPAE